VGRIWLRQLVEHRRQILRGCTNPDTHTNSNLHADSYSDSDCYAYANGHAETYADAEDCTHIEAAPHSRTAPEFVVTTLEAQETQLWQVFPQLHYESLSEVGSPWITAAFTIPNQCRNLRRYAIIEFHILAIAV
jgi:hypothetical protein